MSFHDRWQAGQLLSSATTDLSIIRRFLSFGLVFLVVNIATFVVVVALLIHLYLPLGVMVALSSIPLSPHLARPGPRLPRRLAARPGPAG